MLFLLLSIAQQGTLPYDLVFDRREFLWSTTMSITADSGRHDAIFGTYEDLARPPDVYRFDPEFASRDRVSKRIVEFYRQHLEAAP